MNILPCKPLLASVRLRADTVRHVGSVGPLAAAFNSRQSVQFKFNWLQSRSQTGLFGVPELTDSRGWAVLQERCFRNCQSLVEEVTSQTRYILTSHLSPHTLKPTTQDPERCCGV